MGDGYGFVLKSKMKLRPWKNLEKKMKCGPSICGMDGIQIWQRRIRAVCRKARKKRVWISPYTLFPSTLVAKSNQGCAGRAALGRLTASRIRRPARAYARVNQLCLFSASRPFTTTPASASFFSRLPVIIGVTTSRPISAAWL